MTRNQALKIDALFGEWFSVATRTDRADRSAAEKDVRSMAEHCNVAVSEIVWVDSPQAGSDEYKRRRCVAPETTEASIWSSVRAPICGSTWDSIWGLLGNTRRAAIRDSVCGSLGPFLGESLWDSALDSVWDVHRVAWFHGGMLLGAECSQQDSDRFSLLSAVLRSCFSVWIGRGWAIVCDRPTSVEIVNGRLVGADFA